MPAVIQQHDIPAVIRSIGGLNPADYVEVFAVATNGASAASPEQWFRTAIEDVAGQGGQFIWRRLLGLRLDSRAAADRLGGWKIGARGDDWIRIEASSWFLTAHLVARLEGGHLWAATLIRYDHPIARLIWLPASAVHRRLMPGLLQQTVRLRSQLSESVTQRRQQPAARSEGGQ